MTQKYVVDLVVPTIVDTAILAQGLRGSTITVDEVERNIRGWNIDLGETSVRQRCEELERSGHIRRSGNGFQLTDDGRSDVQTVLPWFRELNNRVVTQVTPGMTR